MRKYIFCWNNFVYINSCIKPCCAKVREQLIWLHSNVSYPAGSYTRHISEECSSCSDSGLSPLKRVVSPITSARATKRVLNYTLLLENVTCKYAWSMTIYSSSSIRLHITAIFAWHGVMFLIFNVLKLSLASYTKPNLVILYFYSTSYEL